MRKKLTSLSLLAFLGLGTLVFAQTKGTVNDENGFPEADVEVTVKGTNKTVFTDENGSFDIDAKVGDVLVINGTEYIVASNNLGVLKPKKTEIVDLAETVVTAFGVQKKETVVGSEYSRVGAGDYYVATWESMRNGRLATNPTEGLAAANAYASNNFITNNLVNNIYGVPNNQVVVDGQLTTSPMLYNDFNWQDYITRTGSFQKYDVDYSGATDNTSYFAGFGYTKETGYVIKSDFERYSARASVDTQVTDWLKMGTNLSGSLVKSNQANDSGDSSFVNPFYATRAMGPIYSPFLYDANGQRVYDTEGNPAYDGNVSRGRGSSASAGRNVLQETLLNNNLQNTNSINSRFFAEFKLLPGLTFTTNLGYDVRNYNLKFYGNKVIGDAIGTAALAVTTNRYTTVTWNQVMKYQKSFGQHNFDALVGHESFSYQRDYTYTRKIGEAVSGVYELVNFLTPTSTTGYNQIVRKEGYFARVNYDFASKYLLSASIRQDQSSRFAPQSNKGIFWSAGAGWNLHKEGFLKGSSVVNELKLRASYGQVGNDGGISAEPGFQTDLDLYSLGYNNGTESGVLLGQLGNPDLTWESKNQLDLGLDFAFFKRRVTGSVEYYSQDIVDMIFQVPTPNSAGVPNNAIYGNIGKMRNSGLEIALNLGIVRNEKFSWDLSVLASTIKNEILKMPKGKDDAIINGTKRLAEGQSLYSYWLRQWYGVDSSDGAALYIQDDAKADDVSTRTVNGVKVTTNQNNALMAYSGTSIPDVFGSITNNFKFGNFDASVMLNYQLGGQIYDNNYSLLMSTYPQGQAIHTDMLSAWKNPGDVTNVPIMSSANVTATSIGTNSRWLTKADYLSIRNVTIGYNFNKRTLEAAGLKNLRVYASGENLYSWTARKGLEPGQSFNGTTTYRYTPSRTVSVGLNVSF